MTATTGMILVNRILPLIAAAIGRGAVRPTGCEDAEELKAEGVALAAKALESAEIRGKDVPPQSVAYYAVEALKHGRRSGYAGHTDVLSPAATLRGLVNVRSMDEAYGVASDDPDEVLSLHTSLASSNEDPATTSAREIDWGQVMGTLQARERQVVVATARGVPGTSVARRLKVSPPRVVQLRQHVAERVKAVMGGSVMADVVHEPGWRAGLRIVAERRAGRYERAHGQGKAG